MTKHRLPRVADAFAALNSNNLPWEKTHSQSSGTLTPDSQQSELLKMADAIAALSKGSLRQVTEESLQDEQPIVQCVQIKPMASAGGAERYRVVMSDSVNFMQGMLGQRKCKE